MLMQTLLTFLLAISSLPGQPIVIRGGAVLDGKGGMQRNRDILVEGSRITQVALPKGPPTYDLSRYTLMPGWIDTHVHLSGHFSPSIGQRGGNQDDRAVPGPIPTTARGRGGAGKARGDRETSAEEALYTAGNAYTTLLAGFTTVQSLGAAVDVPVRDLINAEVIPGPRILTALRMIRADTGAPEQIREEIRKPQSGGRGRHKGLRHTEHPYRRRNEHD